MRRVYPDTAAAPALLPPGRRMLHFYYSPEERVRFVSHLAEAVNARERPILACSAAAFPSLVLPLQALGVKSSQIVQAQLPESLERAPLEIARRLQPFLRPDTKQRLLVDFGVLAATTALDEFEAVVARALDGFDCRCLTQYEGHNIAATCILRQFHTHDWVIAGTALQNENRSFAAQHAGASARRAAARA